MAELRSRTKNVRELKKVMTGENRTRSRAGWKMEWDSIFWILASFSILYMTEFASHILFNHLVRRDWLLGAVFSLSLCIGCLVYAVYSCPTLDPSNWHVKTPYLISIATLSALIGSTSLFVSIWPVWRYYTIIMLPTLFMGVISTVSLLNL